MTPAVGRPDIRAALDAVRDGTAALLITGGMGTGKTTLVTAVLAALRDGGQQVLTRAPRDGDDPAATVVVDDAHLLAAAELERLADLAEVSARTLVVAAEARDHDPGLRTLITALEHRGPRLALGALDPTAVSAALAGGDGRAPDPDLLGAAVSATAGIPFLVADVAGLRTPADIGRAAFHALTRRVRRLDERTLAALLISTLSADLGAADIAAALDLTGDDAFRLVDQIRGTGLVEPSHPETFRASVHRAVAQTLGAARHHDVESALLRTQIRLSTLSGALALVLAEHGLRDRALTGPLISHAAAFRHDAAGRARILRAAIACGATEVRTDLADALALAAACPDALATTDDLLTSDAPTEQAAGVRVAAAVASHDGNGRQAAELFGWLGNHPEAVVGAAAAIAHLGAGDAAAAAAALDAGHTGAPTAIARAARSLGEGVLATTTRSYPAAASRLGQSAAGGVLPTAMPDSAAALATLAALHNGDAARAHSVISRALAGDGTGDGTGDGAGGAEPMFAHRHRLLLGWIQMQEGHFDAAAEGATDDGTLHRRDALWAAALRTAIARRSGDIGALQQHWYVGVDILAECAVDLYMLLPLGELWVAGARLRQPERLAPAWDQARALLGALGNPSTWSLPLHWAGLHAGILANDPASVAPHGQALAAAAGHSPFAAALAAAGRAWLRVLAGTVGPTESQDVIAAARTLSRFGLTADATRLTGQAALGAEDPKLSALLLAAARDLKALTAVAAAVPDATVGDNRPDSPSDAPRAPVRTPPAPGAPSTALSDREREVAELLLLGMPYRDIGARLFISAKTVEHHVARIRRRLGAGSRSELLSMLRTMPAREHRPDHAGLDQAG